MMDKMLNDLIALFSVAGYNLRSAKYAFRQEGLRGFARFLKNEEKERWELQDCLIKDLADMGIKVTLGAIPAPINSWSTPITSIGAIVDGDDKILVKIEKIQKDETVPAEIEYVLMKLAERVRKERSEVERVSKELGAAGDLYVVDQSLYERYKCKAVSKY